MTGVNVTLLAVGTTGCRSSFVLRNKKAELDLQSTSSTSVPYHCQDEATSIHLKEWMACVIHQVEVSVLVEFFPHTLINSCVGSGRKTFDCREE